MAEMGPEIGATLRETRMRARIDIGEVEMRTKIRAKYLRAIENEEWDLLPGPVYVKSFLRTYGDYLGLDSRLLLDEYKRRYELAPDAQHRPISAVRRERERERERSMRRRRSPSVPSWAFVLVVLVAAGVALYFLSRHGGSSPSSSQARHITTPVHTTTRVTHRRRTHRAATRVLAVRPHRATLKLVPTGSVWICVTTTSGAKLINGVVESPGASIPALRGSALLVTLGNANVDVTANGRRYPLNASSTAIGLKVTSRGVTTLPQGPTCA